MRRKHWALKFRERGLVSKPIVNIDEPSLPMFFRTKQVAIKWLEQPGNEYWRETCRPVQVNITVKEA